MLFEIYPSNWLLKQPSLIISESVIVQTTFKLLTSTKQRAVTALHVLNNCTE